MRLFSSLSYTTYSSLYLLDYEVYLCLLTFFVCFCLYEPTVNPQAFCFLVTFTKVRLLVFGQDHNAADRVLSWLESHLTRRRLCTACDPASGVHLESLVSLFLQPTTSYAGIRIPSVFMCVCVCVCVCVECACACVTVSLCAHLCGLCVWVCGWVWVCLGVCGASATFIMYCE